MKLSKDPLNIITASVGGQGNILASEIVGSACTDSNLKVTIGETHGLSQRGGSVVSYKRVSNKIQYGPMVPKQEVDIILGFEPLEAFKVFLKYGSENTVVILNNRPNYPTTVLSGLQKYPELDEMINYLKDNAKKVYVIEATELAREAGNTVAMNVAMVGALSGTGLLPVERKTFEKIIGEIFSDRKFDINIKAFNLGFEKIKEINEEE